MNESSQKKGGFITAIISTAAAFFGVQSDQNRQRDFSGAKPSHFIIAGFILTALFAVSMWLLASVAIYFLVP